MNKTLLLILCDFLLLTLLALARWDAKEPSRPAPGAPKAAAGAHASTSEQDMVAVMKISLEDEQARRDALTRDLAQTELLKKEAEKTGAQLAESLAETKASAQKLDTALAATRADVSAERARSEQLARDLAVRAAEAKRQQEDINKLEQAEASARRRAEDLSLSVKVAEKEKAILTEQTTRLRAEVENERAERQRVQQTTVALVQGVGQLAEQSSALKREIIESRPINANTLFTAFMERRVATRFTADRDSFLGPVNRSRETNTIVASDGRNAVVLLHVDDTPFNWSEQGGQSDWASLSFKLSRGDLTLSAARVDFLSLDPRIVAVPLTAAEAVSLKSEPYLIALEPFKFPEAVLISAGGKGYGELPFKLDPANPGYVTVDNRLIRRLFGEFSPSRGDLVLSKTGELLGIMVNDSTCALITNFLPQRSLSLGENLLKTPTGPVLDEIAARYRALRLRM
ncbi:hypothetical protein IMCC26134_00520 [Verrucomicrobia bacterium IMCC26134]|nr:hypothetical protein IMCC26134_00520 [Verrucomicrobia bacterium IMCC26134]